MQKRRIWLIACLVLALAVAAVLLLRGAGGDASLRIESAVAPDADDQPLPLRIWYPAQPAAAAGSAAQTLPLIVISHGTGGSAMGHEDTARALARAGFVVVAVQHTGDNYRDHSYVRQGMHLTGRPRHVVRTIDYMLSSWHGRTLIDAQRVGLFGFSAGGFTTLVLAGGLPDLARTALHCRDQPAAWDCDFLRRNGVDPQAIKPRPIVWQRDSRIRAAVVAAPAVSYSFDRERLQLAQIPFQLWVGGDDQVVGPGAAEVRDMLPAPPDFHRVDHAGHFAFMVPCDWRLRATIKVMHWFGTDDVCTDPAGFDRAAFHTQFNAAVVAFFRAHL